MHECPLGDLLTSEGWKLHCQNMLSASMFLGGLELSNTWAEQRLLFGSGLVAKSCPNLNDPRDCSLPGSSVHRILQARILEWVAISFSRGSSQPKNWTQIPPALQADSLSTELYSTFFQSPYPMSPTPPPPQIAPCLGGARSKTCFSASLLLCLAK